MVRRGWYNESWRHSLAAKGYKTKNSKFSRSYLQERTADVVAVPEPKDTGERVVVSTKKTKTRSLLEPETQERKLLAEARIKRFQEQQTREARTGVRALKDAQSGDFTNVSQALSSAEVTDAEKRALRAELNRQAVQLAQAGLDVPEIVEENLTAPTRKQIQAIQKEQEIAGRGTARQLAGEAGRGILEGAERGVRAGAKGAFEAATRSAADVAAERAAEQRKFEAATRTTGKFPFADIGENVFLGDGEGGIGKEGTDGTFDFLSDPAAETTPLSDVIVPREKIAPIDFGINQRERSFSEKLASEVESLWTSRHNLGSVDKKPLDKGEKAFKEGNREKLIEAINEQEFQIKQQESRWKLIEQTRQLVESQQNRQSIFDDKSKSPFAWSFLSSGADKIVDETKKINKVKERVKQGADEARSRAANLRGKLQRLDSTVPPEETLPKEEVMVFKQPFTLGEVFSDVFKQNPAVEELADGK